MPVVKVAAVQASPAYYDLAKSLEKAIHFIKAASEQGSHQSDMFSKTDGNLKGSARTHASEVLELLSPWQYLL